MIILAPYEKIDENCERLPHLARRLTVDSIHKLARVCHEEDADYPLYRKHPTYIVWRDHLVFALEYALRLHETLIGDNPSPLTDDLEIELDYAASGEFEMVPPPCWGEDEFHFKQQCLVATLFPGGLTDELRSGTIGWVTDWVMDDAS